MTKLTDIQYFNIRKKLREKYFTDNNFTQLIDIREFRPYLNTSSDDHIGKISEYHFIIKYIIRLDQETTLNTKAPHNDAKKLRLILSNPNQYLNPKSNIQAVYDYLKELSQYTTEQWLNALAIGILLIFNECKYNLPIKPNNNQQVWL